MREILPIIFSSLLILPLQAIDFFINQLVLKIKKTQEMDDSLGLRPVNDIPLYVLSTVRNILLIVFSLFILRLEASNFFINQKISNAGLEWTEEGRAFFEGYPAIKIDSPYALSTEEVFEDKAFLQAFPQKLSSEEIVLIHRENAYKEHRFLDVLNLSCRNCPKTLEFFDALKKAIYKPVLYLKLIYKRPRPFAVIKPSTSVLDTPDTPSYPSLAATESALIAGAFSEFFEDIVIKEKILKLGKAMGKRRVLAGLSFPSDIKGGEQLAKQLKIILLKEGPIRRLMSQAREEIVSQVEGRLALAKFQELNFEGTNEELLHFKDVPLEEFVAKLSLLSPKPIKLHTQKQYFVNEVFKLNEWPFVLDAVLLEAGLRVKSSAEEMFIFEDSL